MPYIISNICFESRSEEITNLLAFKTTSYAFDISFCEDYFFCLSVEVLSDRGPNYKRGKLRQLHLFI